VLLKVLKLVVGYSNVWAVIFTNEVDADDESKENNLFELNGILNLSGGLRVLKVDIGAHFSNLI
tara:strand:- start:369 stop:560 length:192 start_codon:yes stop_codon:yes gene_type:complete